MDDFFKKAFTFCKDYAFSIVNNAFAGGFIGAGVAIAFTGVAIVFATAGFFWLGAASLVGGAVLGRVGGYIRDNAKNGKPLTAFYSMMAGGVTAFCMLQPHIKDWMNKPDVKKLFSKHASVEIKDVKNFAPSVTYNASKKNIQLG